MIPWIWFGPKSFTTLAGFQKRFIPRNKHVTLKQTREMCDLLQPNRAVLCYLQNIQLWPRW